ncbi:LytR/AlgR family response regulator transcription factor [Chitinophaga sancti]|uniref:LytTR family DNA-binding domain-containing protein n=1 Tax=Chitinophaga sancti TaxID=1004 RepID=A0A1K1SCD4_9BACT|nr:LytTR family DNA-binding domain-containing protein [Chitinophaga sancti]WQD63554.1 LytTR family DNA-binding domain-containing protein [Chitinophaga sancti]WQG90820.1 LytTR family DNA-binding domain-containing protein [Chitinophaga sancti]SFW81701.1 two component transcriptional regulator, LytTR family [Chitinophaga sancti]
MKISCIVTDDEPFARKGLQGYIEKIDFLELKGLCENAVELNSLLKVQPVDVLFLDIEMPYMTGIELLRNLSKPPKVVFTTAYEKYAVHGYELEVLDYLLKPISFERFLKSANKIYDYFQNQPGSNDYFFVKVDSKLEKIAIKDILFVEAMENYVAIYIPDRKIITHLTLKMLQEHLPATSFVQPHKSYLVAIDKVNSIEGNTLYVGAFQIPISKYQKEETLQRILNNRFLKR